MIVHPAFGFTEGGEAEIDMTIIRKMVASGFNDVDTALARLILVSYEYGVQVGIEEASQANLNAQILMNCTGGNA